MCTGIRAGDIVHYEDTEKGKEALRKDAAYREGNDKLDEAAAALDYGFLSGTLASVPSQQIHQSANKRQTLFIHQLCDGKLRSLLQHGLALACMSHLSIS